MWLNAWFGLSFLELRSGAGESWASGVAPAEFVGSLGFRCIVGDSTTRPSQVSFAMVSTELNLWSACPSFYNYY